MKTATIILAALISTGTFETANPPIMFATRTSQASGTQDNWLNLNQSAIATRTIYLDSLIIATDTAVNIAVQLTRTAGSSCGAAPNTYDLRRRLQVNQNETTSLATTSRFCSTEPIALDIVANFELAATTTASLDLSGIVLAPGTVQGINIKRIFGVTPTRFTATFIWIEK